MYIMKMTAFYNITLCSLAEVDRRFRRAYCLHQQSSDGGRKHIWNVGLFKRDYTAL
jgi:hypothetical protein